MAIALGLLAAAFYGSADFCGGIATKRSGMWAVAILSQVAGLVFLLACWPFLGGHAGRADYQWGLLAGVCGGLGVALLYHALSIGKMGIVSPVTAVLAAATPVVVQTWRGERLQVIQFAGIIVVLLALVLISLSREENGRREFQTAGLREAIISGIVLGGFYLFLARAGAHSGLQPLLSARVASAAFLTLMALALKKPPAPTLRDMPLVIFCGALDMLANMLYLLAVMRGYISIAAVLTSLYPAATVLLASLLLRERLATVQYLGLGLALGGVGLISL